MVSEKFYGVTNSQQSENAIDIAIEELSVNGFTILTHVLNEATLSIAKNKMDAVYKLQEDAFGKNNLAKINELNLVRCPLVYDDFFLEIATNNRVLEIVRMVMGDYIILHLQNGIINMPNEEHHQSSWHRDLPYQNFTSSKPLSISALFCIDEFTMTSGSTFVLAFSHKLEKIPSQHYINNFSTQIHANAGSAILFDSMLFHKAGYNSGSFIRRAINNVYTVPIIKQQINLQEALKGKYSEVPELSKFLGYESNVPSSDKSWREMRLKKLSS